MRVLLITLILVSPFSLYSAEQDDIKKMINEYVEFIQGASQIDSQTEWKIKKVTEILADEIQQLPPIDYNKVLTGIQSRYINEVQSQIPLNLLSQVLERNWSNEMRIHQTKSHVRETLSTAIDWGFFWILIESITAITPQNCFSSLIRLGKASSNKTPTLLNYYDEGKTVVKAKDATKRMATVVASGATYGHVKNYETFNGEQKKSPKQQIEAAQMFIVVSFANKKCEGKTFSDADKEILSQVFSQLPEFFLTQKNVDSYSENQLFKSIKCLNAPLSLNEITHYLKDSTL